ncbi:cell wall-binding repeat-containing protein [Herbiconiux ginsengi]|uniref:Putative cell wall binding repeat 2 n=1 Tax=Herbiconiux ginsengi TaxID=381665 RepID=A0A1H3SUY4_9MICO|nr:cell wall-binding repeat-containing protein [Herbiconiux ginsengi]SDZ41458.1 Putative cell wall binding repeat 2 [Herbiconiux ginsengi]
MRASTNSNDSARLARRDRKRTRRVQRTAAWGAIIMVGAAALGAPAVAQADEIPAPAPTSHKVPAPDLSGGVPQLFGGSTADETHPAPHGGPEAPLSFDQPFQADARDPDPDSAGSITGSLSYNDEVSPPALDGGLQAQAFLWNPSTSTWDLKATGQGPHYELDGLAAGDYLVRFSDTLGRDVRTEFYDDWLYSEDADLVPVTAGETTAGIDAELGKEYVWLTQPGGADRYEVAAKISHIAFDSNVPTLYIASGEKYPDALSAGPAAAHQSGALLLVTRDGIPTVTRDAITELAPQKIVVVGGTATISDAVYTQLAAVQPNIVRLAGADRYEVSRNVLSYAFCGGTEGDCAGTGVKKLFVATGANYPDALSAGPAAAHVDGAVLLVPGFADDVDSATRTLITRLGTEQTYVAGGPASVSTGISSTLYTLMGGNSERFTGADRFDVSANINSAIFQEQHSVIFIASGFVFADALSGGPAAAVYDAPLYLVQKECWPQSVLASAFSLHPIDFLLLGGPNTIGMGVSNLEYYCS